MVVQGMDLVRFAIPKGSLEQETYEILSQAGYEIRGQERSYRPSINDPQIELKILRPQEIPLMVADGLQDVGITGSDWIRETKADVEVLLDLEYGRVKLVVAVPKSLKEVNSLSDLLKFFLDAGRDVRISTEFPNLTGEALKENEEYKRRFGDKDPWILTPWWRSGENPHVKLYLSFGATEAKPPEAADAIVDLTRSGHTLEQNDLKVIEVITSSSAVLIANRQALKDQEKHDKIYDILTLLKGVVDGRKKLHIFVNVKRENLERLLRELPALKSPTISELAGGKWCSVNTIIDRAAFLELLPILRKLAQGLVVHEPQQILPLEEIAKDEYETK